MTGILSSKIQSINRRRRNFITAPRTEWMTTDQNNLGNLTFLQEVDNKLCMSISSASIRQYVADNVYVYYGRFMDFLLSYSLIMMTLVPLRTLFHSLLSPCTAAGIICIIPDVLLLKCRKLMFLLPIWRSFTGTSKKQEETLNMRSQ